MKELSIEQKAKRYDKIIGRAKKELDACGSQDCDAARQIFRLFPELAESEDEKIRKDIIRCLKHSGLKESNPINPHVTTTLKDAIAWLEKQGDTKETLCDKCRKEQPSHSCQDITELGRCALEKQGEQKPANTDFSDLRTWKYIVDAVWTEKEGIGQYLDSPFTEEVAKKLQKRFGNIQQMPAEWHREDEQNLNACLGFIPDEYLCRWLKDVIHVKYDKPVWSEADEKIINGITSYLCTHDSCELDGFDKWYDFLNSLKDRVQPKQEWSEEDESLRRRCIGAIDMANLSDYTKDNLLNWLKSLRPQSHWKPSVFHLECIEDAISLYEKHGINAIGLKEILDELKKLKE